ncbi:hypothetical protein K1719_013547 [Acacia pycnantha]|nr:hypothetical protein K1719_013547 [Acacia pycnantha]
MTSLTQLYLDFNSIEGGIPNSVGKLCNLNCFSLSLNNMTGIYLKFLKGTETCPSEKPLHNLQYLILSNNQLGSKIPYWLGQLENIVRLDLSNNSFEGSTGSLQNLHILHLGKSKLNRTLPEILPIGV